MELATDDTLKMNFKNRDYLLPFGQKLKWIIWAHWSCFKISSIPISTSLWHWYAATNVIKTRHWSSLATYYFLLVALLLKQPTLVKLISEKQAHLSHYYLIVNIGVIYLSVLAGI